MPKLPCVLTIGGLDPSGGAGLPADARAVAAFGAHACSIATAVVAQNTRGVFRLEAVSEIMLAAQLDNLLEDIAPRAVKIGLLPSVATIEIVAARLRFLKDIPIIIDTVFAPSSGPVFSDEKTIRALVEKLVPGCDLLTPNLPEAAQLLEGIIPDAAVLHEQLGAKNVLLKGGHATGETAIDWFCDGAEIIELHAPRIRGYEVRGTGCLLASAIAAQRAQGVLPLDAARAAKAWLFEQIQNAQMLGKGRRIATAE